MKKAKKLYNEKTVKRVQNLAGLVLVFTLWFVLSNFTAIPDLYLPSPQEIGRCFIEHASDIPRHIMSSLYRIAIGFFVGSALGILMGLMIGWSKTVRNILEPLVEFIRPICR